MRKKKKVGASSRGVAKNEAVRRWFGEHVTCEGEPYVMDAEQVAAIVSDAKNTIVVARAGSGKTRTIVAKIVYLIAKCGVKPEEIVAFVFNANAAAEINERLVKMCVDEEPIIGELNNDTKKEPRKAKIATTFHAFARKIVYDACGGRDKCGKILAGEKEGFVLRIVRGMAQEAKWRGKISEFVKDKMTDETGPTDERGRVAEADLDDKDLARFAKMMTQFVNRAQQKYLGGEITMGEVARAYLKNDKLETRERAFVELGAECYKRYHWCLLDTKMVGFADYGTDFNLIVSWASKLIAAERGKVVELLAHKQYILIDEYQDFSQLFLAAVEAVRKVAKEAKLFVVGDDWQAINRFAGSEVEYFREFGKYFERAQRYEITTNYRCDRAIVNTARRFMARAMSEKGGFRAFSRRMGRVTVVDPQETECEYAMVEYDRRVSGRDKIYKEIARRMAGRTPKMSTVQYVKTIIDLMRANQKASGILLLHRNNEMDMEGITLTRLARGLKWGMARLGIMVEAEFDVKVQVMTMHKSKGLEAEVVIILEADVGVIPRLHPDTALYGIFGETDEIALDDQKRLFYVAMTRAKKRLYIINNESGGKGFAKYLGKL